MVATTLSKLANFYYRIVQVKDTFKSDKIEFAGFDKSISLLQNIFVLIPSTQMRQKQLLKRLQTVVNSTKWYFQSSKEKIKNSTKHSESCQNKKNF